MRNNAIVAVIVTFNRMEKLEKCIRAIDGQTGAECDILIIDNGSTDGTADMIDRISKELYIQYYNTGANTGSAGGFHYGVKEAVVRGYERIWIMDDDIVPHQDALLRFKEADDLLGGDWGFLSGLALWKDGTPCKANIQKKGLFSFVKGDDYRAGLVPVYMAAMASLYLNADAVRSVGLPIAEYFFYTDDYEYTCRIAKQYKGFFVPSSIAVHEMDSNVKADIANDTDDRLWRYRYLYRNDVHCYRRQGILGYSYLLMKAMYSACKIMANSELADRNGRLKLMLESYRDGATFNPPIRTIEQAKTQASDDGNEKNTLGDTQNDLIGTQTAIRKVAIFQESWGNAGIETFVMNLIRHADASEYAFEVYSAYDWDSSHDMELQSLGVRRVTAFSMHMPSLIKRFVHGTRLWDQRLAAGGVDIVHINAMNGVTLAYVAIAKHRGVPIRIAHSHNSNFGGHARVVMNLVHRLSRLLWGQAATNRIACSSEAGKHLFGKRDFRFVPNGIDIERFSFNLGSRDLLRRRLGLADDVLLVGSIGRISEQKNPLFSVRVLAELIASEIDARLILVGSGNLEPDVALYAERLGISDLVIHIPSVTNPEDYYSAMDVFLMPSVYEGLPYTLIEAQCSGLPCIVSEAIPDEACVTSLVKKIGLDKGSFCWAEVLSDYSIGGNRGKWSQIVASAGYGVSESVDVVLREYGD